MPKRIGVNSSGEAISEERAGRAGGLGTLEAIS
jgi:glucan phosphorylase